MAAKFTLERFWARVDKTSDCWLWTGAKDRGGYGRICYRGIHTGAHRVAFELMVGSIPTDMQLDHLCKVRNCVNPAHLEPVTGAENRSRGVASPVKTHCIHGHEFTAENTRLTVYPTYIGRTCRACVRRNSAQYNLRRAGASA